MRIYRSLLLVTAATGVVGVAGAQEVRDSAGLKVYDYRLVSPRPAFVVADSPHVRIRGNPPLRVGSPEALADAFFASGLPGPSAMLRLRDGRLAVAVNYTAGSVQLTTAPTPPRPVRDTTLPPPRPQPVASQAPRTFREIRLFDSTGGLLARIREDSALRFIDAATMLRETAPGVVVVVINGPGWTQIDLGRSTLVTSVRRVTESGVAYGVFANGEVLAARQVGARAQLPFAVEGYRVTAVDVQYERASVDGARRTPLPIQSNLPSISASAPYRAWPYVAPHATIGVGGIWLFDAVPWQLRLADDSGRVRAVVRPPMPARIAGKSLGDRFPDDSLYRLEVLADDRGRLWMDSGHGAVPPLNLAFGAREWYVFETDGQMLGSVIIPAGFRPFQIVGDELIGAYRTSATSGTSAAIFRVRPAR
jgi:hypothetical protein